MTGYRHAPSRLKIFVTENTESDFFLYERVLGKIHHCRLKFIVTSKMEKVHTYTGTEVAVTV